MIGQHTLVVDEPLELGGADSGPNPVQLVLAALGASQEILVLAHGGRAAVARASAEVAGGVDLRGFFGAGDDERQEGSPPVRAGFVGVKATISVEQHSEEGGAAGAPLAQGATLAAAVAGLRGAVEAQCEVLDSLRSHVPVEVAVSVVDTSDSRPGPELAQRLMAWDKGGIPPQAIEGIRK